MKTLSVFAACVGLLFSSAAFADDGDYRVDVGQYHPDITLPSIETGKPVSLRQFRGKKTLLIHFASW